MALITIPEVKTAFDITNISDNALITTLLASALSEAQKYCGRMFEQAQFTEYLQGDGGDTLIIKNTPISTAVSVSVYDDSDRAFGVDTLIAAADLDIWLDEGIIKYDGNVFAESKVRNVKVVYTGGYTAATVPADLKQALIFLVGALYYEQKGAILITSGENVEDRPQRLRDQAHAMLDKYRSGSQL